MDTNGNQRRPRTETRNRHAGGSNQARVRDYNMRLILSLALRSDGLPRAEMARLTGLSAQTISVIMRELEAEGLLLRGNPQRGRVGQPSIPMTLNPDGAFALGMAVGRRSTSLVLIDFVGQVRQVLRRVHTHPDLATTLDFAEESVRTLLDGLPRPARKRVCGLGIAMPYEIWDWTEIVGVDQGELEDWRGFDIAEEMARRTGLKTIVENDCAAACSAENAFGVGSAFEDFAYIYVASFIGGGVVLNGALYPGPTGNAGAFGSAPVVHSDGSRKPLLGSASLYVLEEMLETAGQDPSALWMTPEEWPDFGVPVDRWIGMAARYIAQTIVSACSTIDFPAVIIDGALPSDIRRRLVDAVSAALEEEDMRGLSRPQLLEGRLGASARAVGGGSLALVGEYLLDRNVLTLDRT